MAATAHHPSTHTQHGTWTVRKNLHYLATQSFPTNRVMKRDAEHFPAYWLHVWPERNLEPWKVILDTLRANIPTCKVLQDSETSAVTATNNARAALYQAELVIFALGQGKDIAEAKDFVDAHFYMLLECWNDVLKWLLYLMLNTPTTSDPLAIFTSVRAFAAMVLFPGWAHLQEEILDKPQTIDFIYLMLSQEDPDSGLYWYIPKTVYQPGCLILGCLKRCLDWESTEDLLRARFKAMRSDSRAKVVKSLSTRPKRMCSGIIPGHGLWCPAEAGLDLSTLSLVVCKLGQDPDISKKVRRTVCHNIADSLSKIVADEVEPLGNFNQPNAWYNMTAGILHLTGREPEPTVGLIMPHSHHRIQALVRANVVSTAFKCLVRLMAEGERGYFAELVLRHFLANMTDSEVYRDVLRDLTEKEDILGRYIREVGSRSSIAQQYKRVLEISRLAFEVSPCVRHNLCANDKHPESSTGEEGNGTLRQCSDCLSVAYCSEQCRTEDWSRFHSHECKLLARTQNDFEARAASYSYVSQSVRQDQLRFLEYTINSQSSPDIPLDPHQATHAMIDFRRELGDLQSMDLSEPVNVGPHPQGELRCPGAFQERVAQYSNDAMAEPEKYICVEAIFSYDWQWATHVFAKLQHYPEATESTRFRLIDSVFVFRPTECISNQRTRKPMEPDTDVMVYRNLVIKEERGLCSDKTVWTKLLQKAFAHEREKAVWRNGIASDYESGDYSIETLS
ncbi:hypothetical protein DFP72DRAFT_1108040 [Ephemerocybe angulata]|uniref:MYND-type domain-containing protein n=1 Tax=Ephemerocybe angulata TaxID=980116 RepID=A0A8H6MGA7_9AGAR|nr:hypothetical protein DFP72DRAFT_1108040 [Tulosesus angulatus]